MPIHKDSYNDKGTYNLVIPLEVASDAGLWQELRQGDPFEGPYMSMEHKGREIPGQFYSLRKGGEGETGQAALCNPAQWRSSTSTSRPHHWNRGRS